MSAHDDLKAWIDANAPASLRGSVATPFQGYWGGRQATFASDDERLWFERCAARGLTAPGWPVAYGGAGLSADQVRAWRQHLAALGLPLPLVGFGLAMLGPILLRYGTEAQKQGHVTDIAQGRVAWCQGYSEPGAGSDLASLRTRAVREGDELIVTGQKIWTSRADRSDAIFCLVRTSDAGPRQHGITFLLIPMDSPGITVRPITLISGASPFCEVFFQAVRVPVDHVVGAVDDGWKVARSLLEHERGMVGESIASGGARPPELMDYSPRQHATQVIGLDPAGRVDDPLIEAAVLSFEDEERCFRSLVRRIDLMTAAGASPGPESSLVKLVGTELNQSRWELALRIGGLDTLGWTGPGYGERDLALVRQWLRARGNSIEGGTSEIQRNIIARTVLGLPQPAKAGP